MIYHYSRSNDQEHFTLVGPLAKIDWRGFLGFEFLGPMDVLELRGEVAVWFAKNMNLEHGEQKDAELEYDQPDAHGRVCGPGRRV